MKYGKNRTRKEKKSRIIYGRKYYYCYLEMLRGNKQHIRQFLAKLKPNLTEPTLPMI